MSHSLNFARQLADQVASALRPHCTRLRREAEQIGDLELVVIPRVAGYREFQAVVNAWPAVRGKARKALPLVEEEDVFRELGLAWVEPRMRTGAEALRREA